MDTITLRQAVQKLREQGTEMSFGTFATFEDFEAYARQHYIPGLRHNTLPDNLSSFLANDLNELLK